MHRSLTTLLARHYMANSNYVNNKPLPRVYMDLKVDQQPSQRVVIELFENIVPRTTENFLQLIKDGYQHSKVSRLIPGLGIQMGSLPGGDRSIYGPTFEDESYAVSHDQPGILTMLNQGKDSNASQFLITLNALPHLDFNNVAFGKVVEGQDFVLGLDRLGDAEGLVKAEIVVEQCGEL